MEKTKDKLDIELPTVEEITLQDSLEAAREMVAFEYVAGYLAGLFKGIYIGAKRYAGIQKPPQQ